MPAPDAPAQPLAPLAPAQPPPSPPLAPPSPPSPPPAPCAITVTGARANAVRYDINSCTDFAIAVHYQYLPDPEVMWYCESFNATQRSFTVYATIDPAAGQFAQFLSSFGSSSSNAVIIMSGLNVSSRCCTLHPPFLTPYTDACSMGIRQCSAVQCRGAAHAARSNA